MQRYRNTLDSGLTFNEHVASLTSSMMSSLCQINRVKHLFPKMYYFLSLTLLSLANYSTAQQYGQEHQNRTLTNYNSFRILLLEYLLL